jgi:glutamate 5-kinase
MSDAAVRRALLSGCRNLVIKVGSAVLAAAPAGGGGARPARRVPAPAAMDGAVLLDLVQTVADLIARGHRVSLVSSGAILSGMIALGYPERPRLLPEKQACAAVGQIELMARYRALFEARGVPVGQLLLTADDFRDRSRFLNARNTILTLLDRGILPIINENDTVSVDEIKLGDNDNLSALVLNLVGADLLVLLSDVEGLLTADPRRDAGARRLPVVQEGAPELAAGPESPPKASRSTASVGTGGIATKLAAVREAMALGVPVVLACGKVRGAVGSVLAGNDIGTLFVPRRRELSRKKHWMAFAPAPRGSIVVDAGAARALAQGGKSLLPSGVRDVSGEFSMGDLISLVGPGGREVARGLASYSADEVRRIRGAHTSRIEEILGRKDYDEVVHRDNLVLTRELHA